jgi:uncharacterized protein
MGYSERGVLWRSLVDGSLDRCSLLMSPDGPQLRGEVVTLVDGDPVRITYLVVCDPAWETRAVEVTWHEGASVRELSLEVDAEKRWWQGEIEIESVRGCIDVDLGITPATNTLPIRRLAPQEGQAKQVTAAWVLFPELKVEPLPQTYTRLTEDLYRYESNLGSFTAQIRVDDWGLVTWYEGGWERVTAVDS